MIHPPCWPAVALAAGIALSGCGSVGRDIDHLAAAYDAPAVAVEVQTSQGLVEMRVRESKSGDRIAVLLETGNLKRALAKDFGRTDTALPEEPFREAANQRLKDTRNGCSATDGVRRQDYLWEFTVLCAVPTEPRKRR